MNNRHPGRPKREGSWPTCRVEGCSVDARSKGLCATHYASARRGQIDMETGAQLRPLLRVASYGEGALCYVEGCPTKARAGGMCSAHWQRQKKGLELGAPIKERPLGQFIECFIPGCSLRANSHGMCMNHAERRRRGFLDEEGNVLRARLPSG